MAKKRLIIAGAILSTLVLGAIAINTFVNVPALLGAPDVNYNAKPSLFYGWNDLTNKWQASESVVVGGPTISTGEAVKMYGWDSTTNKWTAMPYSIAGGSSWTDGGTYLYPTTGEGLIVSASSTFASGLNITGTTSSTYLSSNAVTAKTSAGFNVYSVAGSQVANFGAGGGQAVTFYNGGTFVGALSVGNSSHGDTIFEAKATTANGSTGIIHGYDSNSTELFSLQSNGNLGLSNLNPVYKLDLGTTATSVARMKDSLLSGITGTSALTSSSTATNIIAIDDIYQRTKEPTGFENQTDSTLSFNTGNRTFTIQPAVSSFNTFYRGKKTNWTIATSTVISNTFGLHFIFIDSSGVLQDSTTAWDIGAANAVSVATIYWNASSSLASIQDERHGISMDGTTHAYLHQTVSSRYQTGYSLTADNNRATTTAGVIWDEDIQISTPQQTQFEVWNRRTDGNWDMTGLQNAYYRTSVGGVVLYDNAGASTTVSTTNYVAYWFFASDDLTKPIKVVMGQRQDTTLANAQANNTYSSLILTGSPMANESKIIWRVIMRNVAGTPTFIESQDQRAVSTLAGGGTAVQDHGTLTGLLDDDHTQYVLVDGTRAMTNLSVSGTATTTNLSVTTNSALGTIVSGTWNGSAISPLYGGTGITSFSGGSLLYALSANVWTTLASSTNGSILQINSSGFPSWVSTTTLNIPVFSYPSFTYATSTWSATTTINLGVAPTAETWVSAQCYTNAGTLNVSFLNNANRMNLIGATTATTSVAFTTNNVFVAGSKRSVDIGTPATTPVNITCTIKKTIN